MRSLALALSLVTLLGCEKSKGPTVAAAPTPEQVRQAAKADRGKAEVEFFGEVKLGELKPSKLLFVAQVEPCTPVPEKPTRYGEETLKVGSPLFAEFFIPQGSTGHACVYAYDDAGKLIGAAGSSQNPMIFQGKGEVIFSKLEYTLTAP